MPKIGVVVDDAQYREIVAKHGGNLDGVSDRALTLASQTIEDLIGFLHKMTSEEQAKMVEHMAKFQEIALIVQERTKNGV